MTTTYDISGQGGLPVTSRERTIDARTISCCRLRGSLDTTTQTTAIYDTSSQSGLPTTLRGRTVGVPAVANSDCSSFGRKCVEVIGAGVGAGIGAGVGGLVVVAAITSTPERVIKMVDIKMLNKTLVMAGIAGIWTVITASAGVGSIVGRQSAATIVNCVFGKEKTD